MNAAPTLNETAALERHTPGGLDLANAGAGLAAAADASITVAWAQKYAIVYQVVDQIVDTPVFPVGFWPMPLGVKPWDFRTPWLKHPSEDWDDYGHRRRIAAAGGTAAALWGEGYGWSPPQSWRLLYVANGKVSLYAEGVLALLRGAGFAVEKLERSETRAALRIRRPGADWQEYEFTWADACRAGYVPGEGPNKGKDKGGNDKYHLDPKTMLWARAVTTGGRIEAPDVIAGMPVAELIDDEPIEAARGVEVTATAGPSLPGDGHNVTETANRTSSSAILRAALDQGNGRPVADDEDERGLSTHSSDDDFPPIEQTDWRRLMARFNELGVNGAGRDAKRLRVMSEIVGHDVHRGSELTKGEAQLILDNLAGASGAETVAQILGFGSDPDPEPTPHAEPGSPPLLGEHGAESPDEDVPEPEQGDGGPAALEGVADPWADPGAQS